MSRKIRTVRSPCDRSSVLREGDILNILSLCRIFFGVSLVSSRFPLLFMPVHRSRDNKIGWIGMIEML
jgi:hypothetical protein